ncbi:hypothetical protein FHS85_001637 [Rhodoligotrophos appendicifer]|uniref:hypothetical protein n=1 Tax=Rhodoligotrophos appendicifer TaxID=987056 RepID=UPI0011860F63|nr:hypothetical protein [Rhodoligotrophos appendicifer]
MMALILSPLGRSLGLAAAILASIGWIYGSGYSAARSRCDTAALRQRLEILAKGAEQVRRAEKTAEKIRIQLEARLSKREKEIQTYARDLESRPRSRLCELNADDVRRLRALQ